VPISHFEVAKRAQNYLSTISAVNCFFDPSLSLVSAKIEPKI